MFDFQMVLKRSKTPETLFHKQIIFMTFIGAPEIRRKDRIVENDCFSGKVYFVYQNQIILFSSLFWPVIAISKLIQKISIPY